MSVLRDQRLPTPPEREVKRETGDRVPHSSSQAVVLTGVRRSGKSTLLAQLLRRDSTGIQINFEDTRLFGLGPEDFPALLSVLEEISGGRGGAVGLDEVQAVREWQRLVRTLLDQGHAVYVTGSNASLLGRELGAKLTGRHRSSEVLPFSYREFLVYTGQDPAPASLGAYLDDGGFPTFLREREPEILRTLLLDIIHRDIAARHRVREIRHLLNLALFLLANAGQPLSLQRLTKSLAIPTVGQTSRYVEHLADAYLLFPVPKYSPSFQKRVVSPPKYYAVDTGLRRANNPQESPDVGRRLENALYLELRRRGKHVSYAAERDLWECDFVTEEAAIQVTAELTESNKTRELSGLVQATRLPPRRRRALVLTMRQEERLTWEGVRIEVIPTWKWLSERL